METLEMNREFWQGKRVFITGHTGFKGSWLALWLVDMGAEVHGYALEPLPAPCFFSATDLQNKIAGNTIADIRNLQTLSNALKAAKPDIVFHLAAQALVRLSYSIPVETFAVNVMGTVNLLEAIRNTSCVKSVVNITTDKCYENQEWVWPYRETDPIGGSDPYSSSKACSETVTTAFRRSFFNGSETSLASARAGNVIGGGDSAPDRLLPDFLRAIDSGQTLKIRSPGATRPWQHVLEPLSGYLTLAEFLFDDHEEFAEAWNFGPCKESALTVQWIVEKLCATYPGAEWECVPNPQLHEAKHLKLDSSKANSFLNWYPRWNLNTALEKTLDWHTAWKAGRNMSKFSLEQIHSYEKDESIYDPSF